MRQTAGVAPSGMIVHLWATRMQPQAGGPRQAPFINRWPATLVHVPREQAVKLGYLTETLHTLAGPAWKGKLLQAGDLITKLIGADGTNWVRPDKPWIVVGRVHEHGLGDLNGQVVICREEI